MTNNEIIATAAEQLVEEGVLKTVNVGGMEVPEAIHTFAGWKELGYQVKKGEKAIAKFSIWKHAKKTVNVDGEDKEKTSLFMQTAAFFKSSQVEKITEKEVTA